MEDQDFPLLGVFGELLGVMSDGVYWVRVNVLVSDRDVEGFLGVMGDEVYGVLVNDSDVYGVLGSDSDV